MRPIITTAYVVLALSLGGVSTSAQGTSGTEPKQLLQDQFLYEFEGNIPKHWVVTGGTPYALQSGYHPQTGQAIRITTKEGKASFHQDVLVSANATELAVGNELQGQIHYRVEQKTKVGGAIRLHMQWLNASGQVVTTTEDKTFVDAPDLWTSYHEANLARADIWRTLNFRTTVPAGAVKLRFAIEVNEHTQVALDDFSLTKASKAESFFSVLPQIFLPIHTTLGKEVKQQFVLQAFHLGRPYLVSINGASEFSTDVTELSADAKTTPFTLTFAPKKAGRLPYKTSDRINLTIGPKNSYGASVDPLQIPLHAYTIDPANPPVITADKNKLDFTAGINGAEVTQMLKLSGPQLIDGIKIQLVQEPGTGFRLGANSVYFFPNDVPSANLKAGINPTDIKVSFKPGTATGKKTAKLVITSTDAPTVEIPLTATVTSTEGGTWREIFAQETKITDPRYKEGIAEDIHYYKLGLWSYASSGVLAEPEEKQLSLLKKDSPVTFLGGFRPGQLYREDFPNGIESIKIRSTYAGVGTKLALEVSYDGGGTWTRVGEPSLEKKVGTTIYSFAVQSHRPTTFRFLRTDDASDLVNVVSVEVNPAKAEQREKKADFTELASFAGQTAQPLLDENFDGHPHHARLTLPGWQNIVLGGDRSFAFYDQRENNDINAVREESTAKISFYGAQPGGAPLKKAVLISPLLDYASAKTKELTFRFYKDKPAEGDAFRVSLAPVSGGKITQLYELPINQLIPFGELKEGQWYDLFLDLKQTKEFETIKDFALVFEYTDNGDPLIGNAASYLIDDVTFGRDNNAKLKVDPELISFFELKAERRTEPRAFKVSSERAYGPIRASVLGQGAQKFILTKSDDPKDQGKKPQELLLPMEGATAYVHAYSRQVKAKDNFAAVLYLQTRSAAGVSIKLFATPRTEADVNKEQGGGGHTTPVDEVEGVARGYVYSAGGQLVVVAPDLASCTVYSVAGSLLGTYSATSDRLELPLEAGVHVLLHLRYHDGRTQVIKY